MENNGTKFIPRNIGKKYSVSENIDGSVCVELNGEKVALSLIDAVKFEDLLSKVIENASIKYQIPIVPDMLKFDIECGKVKELKYSVKDHNETDDEQGMILFTITAEYYSGNKKTFFHQCRIFEDEKIREQQLKYIEDIPTVFMGCTPPGSSKDSIGRTGYNLVTCNEGGNDNGGSREECRGDIRSGEAEE